jgi:hypothetical protein
MIHINIVNPMLVPSGLSQKQYDDLTELHAQRLLALMKITDSSRAAVEELKEMNNPAAPISTKHENSWMLGHGGTSTTMPTTQESSKKRMRLRYGGFSEPCSAAPDCAVTDTDTEFFANPSVSSSGATKSPSSALEEEEERAITNTMSLEPLLPQCAHPTLNGKMKRRHSLCSVFSEFGNAEADCTKDDGFSKKAGRTATRRRFSLYSVSSECQDDDSSISSCSSSIDWDEDQGQHEDLSKVIIELSSSC